MYTCRLCDTLATCPGFEWKTLFQTTKFVLLYRLIFCAHFTHPVLRTSCHSHLFSFLLQAEIGLLPKAVGLQPLTSVFNKTYSCFRNCAGLPQTFWEDNSQKFVQSEGCYGWYGTWYLCCILSRRLSIDLYKGLLVRKKNMTLLDYLYLGEKTTQSIHRLYIVICKTLSTLCPHSVILMLFLSQQGLPSVRTAQRLHLDAGDSQLLYSPDYM